VEDPAFRAFVHRELRERARRELAGRASVGQRLVPASTRER
jgi:hypothetical protein